MAQGTTVQGVGRHRWRILGWGAAVGLLLLPLVAMQVTREVQWTASDFVVMGVLMGVIGLLIESAVRVSRDIAYRGGAIVTLLGFFLLIWVNGAVGMIGSENNPANLAYALIPTFVVAGAFASHLSARGMWRTMVGAAAIQAIIGIGAIAMGLGTENIGWPRDIVGVTAIFTLLWLGAAALFARAAMRERADS